MPVLDRPMVQLELGGGGASGASVLLPHAAQVLLDRLLADHHPASD